MKSATASDPNAQPPKNAFAAMMTSARSPKAAKVDPKAAAPEGEGGRQWGSFAQELRNVAMKPER